MAGSTIRFWGSLLPPRLRHILKRFYYPWLLRRFDPGRWPGSAVVQELVRTGDHVVDAGANIGYVSALLARWVGPQGRVEAIEPVPQTYDLLAHNIKALGLSHVHCHPVGLAEHNSEAWMEIPRFADGRENLYESRVVTSADAPAGRTVVAVQLRRLDSLLADRRRPISFLKLDVEGHELPVVQGGWELLKADRPALLIEVAGDLDAPGTAPARLTALLSELGYTPWMDSGAGLRPRRAGERSVDYFFLTAEQARRAGVRSP